MGELINRIPGSCLLISSLPGSALRMHVESKFFTNFEFLDIHPMLSLDG